jgi:hypothetical protein
MTRQEVDAILAAYEADGVKWKPGEKWRQCGGPARTTA